MNSSFDAFLFKKKKYWFDHRNFPLGNYIKEIIRNAEKNLFGNSYFNYNGEILETLKNR